MKPPEREIMKPIVNWPNYKATTLGRIWSEKNKKFLKPLIVNGYPVVRLYHYCTFKSMMVSTIILETFVGICPKGFRCKHINGDISDNRLANIEWRQRKCTDAITSPEDRTAAYDAFKYVIGKPGGITKQWTPRTIRRCFKSVKSAEQARRLVEDFRSEFGEG